MCRGSLAGAHMKARELLASGKDWSWLYSNMQA